MRAIPQHVIIARHKGYFFSQGAMRFFKSRVADFGFQNEKTEIIYFVTSEKNGNMPRKYTIRALLPNGQVDTVSAFQEYNTSATANRHAEKWAKS